MTNHASRLTITRVHPFLGARFEGVDLAEPMGAWYIEGVPYEESPRLLDDLLAHTTRPDCIFQHRWKRWDLVMWDNRCVLHRGRPWDAARHRRVMRRTTVAGEGPTAEPPLATRTPAWEGIVPEGVGV